MNPEWKWLIPLVSQQDADTAPRQRGDDTLRPTLTSMFCSMARIASERSSCFPYGRRHGAVIEVNNRIVATGYNGPPQGWGGCPGCEIRKDEFGKDFRLCPAIHAEANAILSAARHGVSILGGTMYVIGRPCFACRLLIEGSGISRVVYSPEV